MYFESRAQAGQLLSVPLVEKYRYENCAVVALSDGAVLVGEQIASSLHCVLMMLLTEEIQVPGESQSFGSVSQDGGFTYNGMFSTGELEAYVSEFHGYLDEQKREVFQRMNRLLGDGGLINNDLLRDHTVILVSDGLDNGASIEVAIDFLKPVRVNRMVIATPTASVSAVDRMHILADELHILDVKSNFMGANHYFDQNIIPSHEETIAKINQIVLNWR
jgi:putative phosphoribosyl transferase